jgi:hypothetical protein
VATGTRLLPGAKAPGNFGWGADVVALLLAGISMALLDRIELSIFPLPRDRIFANLLRKSAFLI